MKQQQVLGALVLLAMISGCPSRFEVERQDATESTGATSASGPESRTHTDSTDPDSTTNAGVGESSTSLDTGDGKGRSTGESEETDTGEATGGWYAPCAVDTDCGPELVCVLDDEGRGTCSIYGCGSQTDCGASEFDVRCTLGQLSMGATCSINCSGEATCPPDLECVDTSYQEHSIQGVYVG